MRGVSSGRRRRRRSLRCRSTHPQELRFDSDVSTGPLLLAPPPSRPARASRVPDERARSTRRIRLLCMPLTPTDSPLEVTPLGSGDAREEEYWRVLRRALAWEQVCRRDGLGVAPAPARWDGAEGERHSDALQTGVDPVAAVIHARKVESWSRSAKGRGASDIREGRGCRRVPSGRSHKLQAL